MNDRQQTIQHLIQHPQIPVLILGGGINGIGLLRELALQGVPTLLVDKDDFAAGATSKSSRMIHGGLRYLENREFALVTESLLERNRLLANAPHYVCPLKTTIPFYSRLGGIVRSALIFFGFSVRPGERGSLVTRLGLTFYDLVTRHDRRTPTHYLRSRSQSLQEIPGLNPHIVATATYYDAKITQAERLCIELLHDARQANPLSLALNYVAPQRLEAGRVFLKDLPTGQSLPVEPQILVNATGAWVDSANAILGSPTRFMGPTKGSHLVVDCPDLHRALADQMVYYQHADGRVCIVFPFMDKVIMGSTDIPVADPDSATCDDTEIDYMLQTLRGVFPGINVSRQNIVFTFCGCRPLPSADTTVTANISRGHHIEILPTTPTRPFPIYCLIGGKWTTFRALAQQTADQILQHLETPRKCQTDHTPIGGGKNFPTTPQSRAAWVRRLSRQYDIIESRAETLLDRYGTSADSLLASATHDTRKPLRSLPDYDLCEILHFAANESVVHLSDITHRRTTIALLGQATPQSLSELADIIAPVLGWDPDRQSEEIRSAQPPRP